MKKEEIIESIKKIEKISNEILQAKEKIEDEKLERYFCNLEKARMDMYEEIMQRNLWIEFDGGEGTEFIDYNYKAKVENEILKIHIPEKNPPIKKGASYTQKRIVNLVKHNYIRRLKHRYITLGTKGKEYLLENGFEVRDHCRNENNIERLNVISDIASCLIQDNFNFIPSWNMKKEDEPTTHSRRYIGKLEYNEQDEFIVYAIYDGKDDKYVKSIYYDIIKENGYTNAMIFTNDIEKIVLHEKGFYFGNKYTVLVPYKEYGKFLVRNNYKIRNSIYLRLKELYKVELTDFRFADLKLDDDNYIVIMPLVNMEKLVRLHYYFKENRNCKNIHIFGLKEYEKIIEKYIPECSYKSLTRDKINKLLEQYEKTEGKDDGTI